MAAASKQVKQDNGYLTRRQRNNQIASDLDLDYQSFRPIYRELNDNILPFRGRFFISDNNRGDRRNNKMFDVTPYLAARTLSSGMMAGITSPARPWFRLSTPDPEIAENAAVREWLDVVAQRMITLFGRSNLYNALPSMYEDLGTFATAAMMMEDDEIDVFRFYVFPCGTYRIGKDSRGNVNVFYREFRMTVMQLVEKFGKKNKDGSIDWSNFSIQVRELWERGQKQTWIDVCHLIQPNDQYDPRKPLDATKKRFSSCYYERGLDGSEDRGYDDRMLRDSGYDYFPVLCARWQVTGQDVYGTGSPGWASLPDCKQLHHGEKRSLQAIDKKIMPAMIAPTAVRGTHASIISGDVTYIDETKDAQFRPAHLVDFSIKEMEGKQEQVRQRINKTYFVDLLLMMAYSDRRQITAREIDERHEEKLLALGPVLEQLNQDVLDKLIDIAFILMQQAGLIPPAPEEIQGTDLKVEYISVMAQAQKLIALAGLDRFAGFSSLIIERNPDSADKVDFDEMLDQFADAVGLSPKIVRSDEVVAEIRANRAAAQARQVNMQAIAEGAQAAKNLAGADLEGDNALTRLLSAANAGGVAPVA